MKKDNEKEEEKAEKEYKRLKRRLGVKGKTRPGDLIMASRKYKGKKKVNKVSKVMHEFKTGTLHSGSKHGKVVKNRKQAIAIAMSEARKAHQMKKYGTKK